MSNSTLPKSVADQYQQLANDSQIRLKASQQTWRNLVALRTILFLAAACPLGLFFLRLSDSYWVLIVGTVIAITFIAVASFHETLNHRLGCIAIEIRVYGRLLARKHRDWDRLPEVELPGIDQSILDTAEDLDLIHGRSLIRWSSLAGTQTGMKTLATQLTTFADRETIEKRQDAVRELLPIADVRRRLVLQLWNLGAAHGRLEAFAAWTQIPFQLPGWAQRLSIASPLCLLTGLALLAIGTTSSGILIIVGIALALIGGLVNIALVLGFVGAIHNVFKSVDTHRVLESLCNEWFAAFGRSTPKCEYLQGLHREIADLGNSHSAIVGLKSIRWPITFAGMRLQPILYLPFLVLQCCVLWDFRIIFWLDRWRLKHSNDASRWVDCIGKLEALLSAASIAEEYPDWTFPNSMLPANTLFQATSMGHPLLRDDARVPNDLSIQQDRPLLLVTGSNMAGKSTLMRTLGVNISLSRIGAPVCATSFTCEPLELATSIRVRDSLADGVSFFMAELLRLRKVVDFVQTNRTEANRKSLVILDEILQGTNSMERQIAVSHVIQKLLIFEPILMVSTHDLQLADMKGFSQNSQIVHFREHFVEMDGRAEMRFDYRLHSGVAPTTNALKLLELVGLQ